jgi:hypothetical protein
MDAQAFAALKAARAEAETDPEVSAEWDCPPLVPASAAGAAL